MPAGLPGDTLANNQANPSAGRFVTFDPISGPKGSPMDAKRPNYSAPGPSPTPFVADPLNISTGALSTGIGFNAMPVISPVSDPVISNSLNGIRKAGFDDDQIPGTVQVQGTAGFAQNSVHSRMMYIGGGKMIANADPVAAKSVPFVPSEYVAGISILGAGNGGSRDAGAGPAFTGFNAKMVTAVGAVANGAAIEAGFINRSGLPMVANQSAHGSAAAATAAPA